MDAELKAGKYRGPLHGIPWGVKDLFAVKGTPTTWGAADFENRVIDEDAEVVVRLRDAGAVLIAKLSTGQFAQGANWFRGSTKNPWNTTQSSSGSSAGPASATGGGCVAFGIGTETSGSIVGPASDVRHQRAAADVRPREPLRRNGARMVAGSRRAAHAHGRRRRDGVQRDSRRRREGSGLDHDALPLQLEHRPRESAHRRSCQNAQNQQTPDPNFPAFVEKLKALGAKPKDIANPPTVAGSQGGLDEESAAAFDSYVQMKAKELGMDMATVLTTYGRGGGRGGGGGGGGGGWPVAQAPAARLREHCGRGSDEQRSAQSLGAGSHADRDGFHQSQRRRQMLITAWQEYLKDIDLYIGAADTGVHAQTGHPVVVVQMAFRYPHRRSVAAADAVVAAARRFDRGVSAGGTAVRSTRSRSARRSRGISTTTTSFSSVAHKYQINTTWHLRATEAHMTA